MRRDRRLNSADPQVVFVSPRHSTFDDDPSVRLFEQEIAEPGSFVESLVVHFDAPSLAEVAETGGLRWNPYVPPSAIVRRFGAQLVSPHGGVVLGEHQADWASAFSRASLDSPGGDESALAHPRDTPAGPWSGSARFPVPTDALAVGAGDRRNSRMPILRVRVEFADDPTLIFDPATLSADPPPLTTLLRKLRVKVLALLRSSGTAPA